MSDLPDGWVEVNLTDVIHTANTGLDAIKRAPIVLEDTGVKCFRIQDASQTKSYDKWGFTKVEQKNYDKFKLLEGDILIARTGNSIGVNFLVKKDTKSVFNNGLIRLRTNNKIRYDFLYKIISSKLFQRYIQSIAYGTSTQPNMQINVLLSFDLRLPPLPEQKAIANILTAFDKKIALLQAQNQTLETLAQTIFKEWFVDFNYPDATGEMVDSELGKIPQGWQVGRLGDELEIKRGGSPRPIKDFISGSGYRWLKISDASATKSPFIFKIKEHIKKEGLKKTTLLKVGALVLSNSATPGIPKFLELDSCIHDGWLHFPSSNIFPYQYLYLFFKNIRKSLIQQGNGSVFKNLKTDILKNWTTVIPDKKTLKSFDQLIIPIFGKIKDNSKQLNSLTKTRNILLPKLMSGKLRLKNV